MLSLLLYQLLYCSNEESISIFIILYYFGKLICADGYGALVCADG